ncbi:MAG: NAD-dependent protein deacylase [Alphaproteobacteria bacterium]|nr:NAD-dependent protein deacylase [Alphaproteobacteria bacterium]
MSLLWPEPPRIVVLTGAGILRGPGFTTFPGPQGEWAGVSLQEVATPEAFARDPARVQAFYNARRRQLLDPAVEPNPVHEAVAMLDVMRPGEVLLATRNIDDLHERAGSRTVIHLQGELLKARCLVCTRTVEWRGDLRGPEHCPICGNAGHLRPGVVWIGEQPLGIAPVYRALASCKLFVAIGTPAATEPAAGFVVEARRAGARTVEFNAEPAYGNSPFAEHIHGLVTETVPAYVAQLIAAGADPLS